MKLGWAPPLAAALAAILGAADLYTSAQAKFDRIEAGRQPAGSRVTLTPAELNAWVAHEVPEGVRSARLELGSGTATGSALIDFPKLRRAQGAEPGWLERKLFGGEHPVRVTARIASSRGQAQVDLERIEVSGVTLDGAALDFVIQNFLLPMYPTAAVGRPFDLGYGIDRLVLRPSGVDVVMGR